MEKFAEINMVDFGLTITVLIVVYRALTLISQVWVAKKLPNQPNGNGHESANYLVKEIYKATMDTEKRKQQGHFSCQFKDRDEVRDLIDSMKHVVVALNDLTKELRRTRESGNQR